MKMDEICNLFFNSILEDVEKEYLVSSFRGHELCGQQLSLPEGYQGLVVRDLKPEEHIESAGQDQEDQLDGIMDWKVRKHFKKLTYWNQELVPSETDRIHKWFEWTHLSSTVCA